MYTGKWFTNREFFGEDKSIYNMFKFFDNIITIREITHLFDRNGAVDIEIFWQDKSFVGNEIVDGFDETVFCFQVSLENMNFHIIILDVLFHEFTEFCNELRLLKCKGIICLKNRDAFGC
jgi:hypothetical protein